MFDKRQSALFETENKRRGTVSPSKGDNAFVDAGMEKSAETRSGNDALKYSTTGDDFVDQFGLTTGYKAPRAYKDVARDMSILWAIDKRLTVVFTLFLRMITRVTQLFDGTKTTTPQRGQGLRSEGQMRMIWLYINHPDTFWKNIRLFIAVGSWKDVIQLLQTDLVFNGWDNRALDWDKFRDLIKVGLGEEQHAQLIRKYLPQIKTRNKCKTVEAQADNLIGKWIASFLFKQDVGGPTKTQGYKLYRQLKSEGTAHTWQKLISQGKHVELDFDTVHGRALSLMVSGKYLENQGLTEAYTKWIESKPVAKFTGYVHELFGQYADGWGRLTDMRPHQEMTLNKQFKGLVDTAKEGAVEGTSMIVVRDTSGSMGSQADGTNLACGAIAKGLALFFSQMLPDGVFSNTWIEFNSTAKMHKWKGSTPVEMYNNDNASFIGGTDFQSVITLFVHLKAKGIDESEFPTGIICISDGEFNPAELGKTNVESALAQLRYAKFSEDYIKNFKIVLWNLRNSYYGSGNSGNKFETYGDVENVFYFSGYDGATVAFLTGVKGPAGQTLAEPKNARELFNAAMDQEILNMVEV